MEVTQGQHLKVNKWTEYFTGVVDHLWYCTATEKQNQMLLEAKSMFVTQKNVQVLYHSQKFFFFHLNNQASTPIRDIRTDRLIFVWQVVHTETSESSYRQAAHFCHRILTALYVTN